MKIEDCENCQVVGSFYVGAEIVGWEYKVCEEHAKLPSLPTDMKPRAPFSEEEWEKILKSRRK